MKIVGIKTYVVENSPHNAGVLNWIFLKLITDEGIESLGEATEVRFEPRVVVGIIEDMGKQFVIGSDPFNIEKLYLTLYASRFSHRPDVIRGSLISAFEMTCWDIVGQALNQPIYNLLGGRFHEKLRAYSYLYPAPGDTEIGMAEATQRALLD